MCGVFAYFGKDTNAGKIVVEGLKRLDYRGYDSWGVAVCSNDNLYIEKQVGKISDVDIVNNIPSSTIGVAHTRWATTGSVTQANAHPHYSTDKTFALAQNGIVENFEELKIDLIKKGYKIVSDTDTEVITRLIEEKQKTAGNLIQAVSLAFSELEGRNTIIVITNTNEIIAARNGSPLVIGFNPESDEIYLSSDTLSFAQLASKMCVVSNGQLVHIKESIQIYDVKTLERLKFDFVDINFSSTKVDKEGYDHFMLKEINESPTSLNQLTLEKAEKYEELAEAIKAARNVYTIGSGGAGVAASQVGFYLREIGKIRAIALIGADAVEYVDLLSREDIIIAISQSGETADVLEVLEKAKSIGVKIASFVNMPGSMITQLSDFAFMSQSGPEICVMSTKTFVAQVGFGYLIAKTVAGDYYGGTDEIKKLSLHIDHFLKRKENHESIKKFAKVLTTKHDIFLLGKYQNFHIIREGMVKIIEASYKHGHALPAGDLKHYAITLMESGVACLVVISNDKTKHEVINAVNEVKLRGAEVFAISFENYHNYDHYIEVEDLGATSAIMNLIPLQLISYYMAVELGNNVDKPRNIAKSVTVK
ncbi:MAG: glutamine--fructose-6-phosphate transaminase (isomerizing) [bacterium]|nr:glutamine--fructose-6-phosphate transaminase (isomerizing) [bacterium]